MNISKEAFGEFKGQQVDRYTLENDNGVAMKVMNYGCTVTSLIIPDAKGNKADICCGFDTFDGYFGEAYVGNSPYFGCIVGRTAGMMKDGKFEIDGEGYQLETNAGTNQIHGGVVGFDKQVWSAEPVEADGSVALVLKLTSPDGQEGYPGTLDITVTYTLTNNNEFKVKCEATTDKKTPISMTHHSYFNLSAFEKKVTEFFATINSGQYLEADETGALTGNLIDVEGTASDFRAKKKIGDAFEELPLGFEHFFTFEDTPGQLKETAAFEDPESGRKLSVKTTEPCMLFYTGRYTSDEIKREDGTQFGQFRGFCCEASKYPNGANLKNAPKCIFGPGEKYETETVYGFSW